MSAKAVAWARQIPGRRSVAQNEVLLYLADLADEAGAVRKAHKALEAFPGTMTPPQARKAAEALVLAGTARQEFDFDTYSWTLILNVVDV